MIQAAISFGLDGLAFTDHSRLVPLERLQQLNEKYAPFRVFGGIEILVEEGEDVLVFGVHDREMQFRSWPYAELHRFVREQNGCLVLAHPLRYKRHVNVDLKTLKPDAIEVHSMNIGASDEEAIVRFARETGCPTICNSDAHSAEHVGLYYVELHDEPLGEPGLVRLLRAAAYTCRADTRRIVAFNEAIRQREDLIRRLIADGRDAKYYRDQTGQWEGYFDRVKMGKSYVI